MATHGEEKDLKNLDAVAEGTNITLHDEPVAENPESSSGDEFEKAKPDYGRKNSASTDVTELSNVTDVKSKEPEKKRSRWDRWDPMKIKPPPIPKVRGVSREYTAGLWSILTWQWVTPLMTVCVSSQCNGRVLTFSADRLLSPLGN